jgi:hypothetical protein
MFRMPVFTPSHDTLGVGREISAWSSQRFVAVIAPSDGPAARTRKSEARPGLHLAKSASLVQCFDLALNCLDDRPLADLTPTLDHLSSPNMVSKKFLRDREAAGVTSTLPRRRS